MTLIMVSMFLPTVLMSSFSWTTTFLLIKYDFLVGGVFDSVSPVNDNNDNVNLVSLDCKDVADAFCITSLINEVIDDDLHVDVFNCFVYIDNDFDGGVFDIDDDLLSEDDISLDVLVVSTISSICLLLMRISCINLPSPPSFSMYVPSSSC